MTRRLNEKTPSTANFVSEMDEDCRA
jgi:hypothetical protein